MPTKNAAQAIPRKKNSEKKIMKCESNVTN